MALLNNQELPETAYKNCSLSRAEPRNFPVLGHNWKYWTFRSQMPKSCWCGHPYRLHRLWKAFATPTLQTRDSLVRFPSSSALSIVIVLFWLFVLLFCFGFFPVVEYTACGLHNADSTWDRLLLFNPRPSAALRAIFLSLLSRCLSRMTWGPTLPWCECKSLAKFSFILPVPTREGSLTDSIISSLVSKDYNLSIAIHIRMQFGR